MSQDISALLECVRHYYPAGISEDDSRYESSEEIQRLRHQLTSAASDTCLWSRFLQRAEGLFPGCEVSDTTPLPHEPSFSCQVTLPGMEPRLERTREDAVVCRLSVLAPVYALYARHWKDDRTVRESWTRYPPLPPGFQEHEAKLAGLIESVFGLTRLPNELLFTPVAGIHPAPGRIHRRPPWLVELLF